MTRLTLERKKIQLWAGSSCCFLGDTGCSKRTQRSAKGNRCHGNRSAPRLCFGSCGMECMGLGEGGWDTGKPPLYTSPYPKQPPQDHTERFFNNQWRLTGKRASSNAEHCVFNCDPPKNPEHKALLSEGDVRKCQESKCYTAIVSTLD